MLDNFGLMEFLFLALLALLFFGPERLPQMGARLGRWLSKLTQYSKSFMNQWSEEALAIQDAVTEVKGIRDEIVAAQREISDSLNTARGDIDATIQDARATIREAQPSAQAFLEGSEGVAPSTAPTRAAALRTGAGQTSGEEVALAKTQDVVNRLLKERSGAQDVEAMAGGQTDEAGGEADETAALETETAEAYPVSSEASDVSQETDALLESRAEDGVIEAPSADGEAAQGDEELPSKEPKESPFDRTQRILDQLMGKETAAEDATQEGTEAKVVPSAAPAAAAQTDEAASDTAVASAEEAAEQKPVPGALAQLGLPQGDVKAKEKRESAFDRTQRVLDRLMGKEVPAEEEDAAAADRAQSEPAKVEAVAAQAPMPPRGVDPRQAGAPTPGPNSGITYSQFQDLKIQVAMLKRELKLLREELQTLQSGAAEAKGPVDVPVADGTAEQRAAESVEEVA